MRVLIVEDDRDLAESMKFRLEKEGFEVDMCHDGEEGLYYMQENSHDLILLDRMLPSMDGMEVLRCARRANITEPVIFLTALGELHDRIHGLDCGADDYIVKPFSIEELLARIRSVMRRPGYRAESALLKVGDVSLDPSTKLLSGKANTYTLSKREADLMELFFRNPGQTLPRATLLNRVWGPASDVEEGNLDNYIHFLRRRLKTVGSSLNLKTVRGVGYILENYH